MLEKYNVVFKGLLNSDKSEEVTKGNLCKLLRLSDHQVDHMFTNAPIVIKKSVDKEIGIKFQTVLNRAGASCELELIKVELSLEPKDDATDLDHEEQFYCPGCGKEQQSTGLCDQCRAKIAEKNANRPLANTSTNVQKLKDHVIEHREEIKQSFVVFLLSWIKGNLWKAGLAFILLGVFGSKLVLSSVFYTQDKHLVYQTLGPDTTCVKDPNKPRYQVKKGDGEIIFRFFKEFTDAEKKEYLVQWSDTVCWSGFKLEMGNIGSEVIESTSFELEIWQFVKPANRSPVKPVITFRNISASEPREQDPQVSVNKGEVEITELYPGTLVTVKFEGWIDGPEAMVGWDRMLTDLKVNEGSLDVGSPSMTAFARLLTVFF